MLKLIIGNKNYSSWSLRAWLFLSYHDIAFEEVRIPLGMNTTKAEILKYSGAGKVPILIDKNLVVWDSLAILEYISEQYLDGRGWPDNVSARAEARSSSAEMHSSFFALREEMPMNCRAVDRRVPVAGTLENDIFRIDTIWSTLREKNCDNGPWLSGSFSIVDCMFAPVIFRFRTYGVRLSETSEQYMNMFLSDRNMKKWLEQAQAETEVIEVAEAGI